MRKNILLMLIGLLMPVLLMADPVDKDAARQKAEAFFCKKNPSSARRARVQQDIRLALTNENYHVFNLGTEDGFVIISGDDCTDDILGYSDSGTFDAENMPENLRAWLQGYAEQIAWMKANGAESLSSRQKAPRAKVAPLLTSKWWQGNPYNLQTPEINGIHCMTGCVATATAQVMYYWYKVKGYASTLINDIPEYTPQGYPALKSLSAPVTFDWANMTDRYNGNSTDTEKNAVAKLMKYVGYSTKMRYGIGSSGTPDSNVPHALIDYFGYKSAYAFDANEYYYEDLQTVIYTDLAAGRPVLYSGNSLEGAHTFVCDGYDEDDYFHFNWGWSGSDDGYYKLALCGTENPDGSINRRAYSIGQSVVCGIHPTQTVSLPIQLQESASSGDISLTSLNIPTLNKGETVNISMTLRNNNPTKDFHGKVGLTLMIMDKSTDKLVRTELLGCVVTHVPAQGSVEQVVPIDISQELDVANYKTAIRVFCNRRGGEDYLETRDVTIGPALPNLNGTVSINGNYGEVGVPLSYQLDGNIASLPASTLHPQWQINGSNRWKDIPGATGTTYTPKREEANSYVRVVVKAEGYHGGKVSESRKIRGPELEGTVTLTDTQASIGKKISYQLSGAVANIDPELVHVQWSIRWGDKGNYTAIPGETGKTFEPDVSHLGGQIHAMIYADYYSGCLFSMSVPCVKATCTQTPVTPILANSSAYNSIEVTNPQPNQEYIIMEYKNYFSGLTESDWENAKSLGPNDHFLFMGGTVNKVNYVYTRIKETETTLAGTDVRRASIFFGENIYVQDIELTINKAVPNGSSYSVEPLEQDEYGSYYTKVGDVLRLDVTPVPANATNFYGIHYDNWINNYNNGTFYADFACTQPLQEGQSYNTVFYKPDKIQNYVNIGAQYTLGYNWLAYEAFTLHIGSSIGRWYVNSMSATIDVYRGERVWDYKYNVIPSKATLHGLSAVTLVSGEGTAPEIEFVVERGTINVDATNATKGSYFFDVYQNGNNVGGVRVNVVTPEVEEIVLLPEMFTLDTGESLQLTAQLLPTGADEEIIWSSSNEDVATVSPEGIVTVRQLADIGETATITVTAGGKSATSEVRVAGEKYNLYMAGMQITTRNKDRLCSVMANLSEEAMERWMEGEMDITFDGNVLRLKNVIIDATGKTAQGMTIGEKGMTVLLEGDCKVKSDYAALKIGQDASLVGNGTLTLEGGQYGILFDGNSFIVSKNDPITLTIDGLMLTMQSGGAGFYGSGYGWATLVLNSADVTIESSSGAIYDIRGGVELNNCYFAEPEDARMSIGSLYNRGSRATSAHIERGEDPDGIKEIKNEELRMKNEGVWYTIDGRKLSGKPSKAGLYIVGNRKVVIK